MGWLYTPGPIRITTLRLLLRGTASIASCTVRKRPLPSCATLISQRPCELVILDPLPSTNSSSSSFSTTHIRFPIIPDLPCSAISRAAPYASLFPLITIRTEIYLVLSGRSRRNPTPGDEHESTDLYSRVRNLLPRILAHLPACPTGRPDDRRLYGRPVGSGPVVSGPTIPSSTVARGWRTAPPYSRDFVTSSVLARGRNAAIGKRSLWSQRLAGRTLMRTKLRVELE